MIIDYLKNINRYKGINENLDIAIESILKEEYKKRDYGKNIVLDERVYFNFPKNLKTKESTIFESHKDYIDIHIVLKGKEEIGVSQKDILKKVREYRKDDDSELLEGKIENRYSNIIEKFVILFPGEPHIAALKTEKCEEVEKIIYKVLYK